MAAELVSSSTSQESQSEYEDCESAASRWTETSGVRVKTCACHGELLALPLTPLSQPLVARSTEQATHTHLFVSFWSEARVRSLAAKYCSAAKLQRARGHFEAACALQRKALSLQAKRFPAEKDTAAMAGSLAVWLWKDLRQLEAAEALLRDALAIHENSTHLRLLLAEVLIDGRRHQDAEALLDAIVCHADKELRVKACVARARCLLSRDQRAEAASLLKTITHSSDPHTCAEAYRLLAEANTGKEAEESYLTALKIYEALDAGSQCTAAMKQEIGVFYLKRQQYDAAHEFLEDALTMLQNEGGNYWVAQASLKCADLDLCVRDFTRARERVGAAIAILSDFSPKEQARAFLKSAECHHAVGENSEAARAYDCALRALSTHPADQNEALLRFVQFCCEVPRQRKAAQEWVDRVLAAGHMDAALEQAVQKAVDWCSLSQLEKLHSALMSAHPLAGCMAKCCSRLASRYTSKRQFREASRLLHVLHPFAVLLTSLERSKELSRIDHAMTAFHARFQVSTDLCEEVASSAYESGLYWLMCQDFDKAESCFNKGLAVLRSLRTRSHLAAKILVEVACLCSDLGRDVELLFEDASLEALLTPSRYTACFHYLRGHYWLKNHNSDKAHHYFARALKLLKPNSLMHTKVLSSQAALLSVSEVREALVHSEGRDTWLLEEKFRRLCEKQPALMPLLESVLSDDCVLPSQKAATAEELAALYLAAGRRGDAARTYAAACNMRRSLHSDVKTVAELAQKAGALLHETGELRAMREALEAATDYCLCAQPASPHTIQLLRSAGKCSHLAASNFEAAQYYRQAYFLCTDPKVQRIVLDALVGVYEDLEEYEKAETLMRQHLDSMQPCRSASLWRKLAAFLEGLGLYKQAEQGYLMALDLYHRWPRKTTDLLALRTQIAKFYQKTGRTKEAQQHFEDAVEMFRPSQTSMLRLLVSVLLCKSTRVLRFECQFPAIRAPLKAISDFYVASGRFEKLEEVFACVQSLVPLQGAAQLSLFLGQYYDAQGLFDRAEACFKHAACTSPNRAAARLGTFYASHFMFEAQEALLVQTVQREANCFPKSAAVQLGKFYRGRRQTGRAEACLKAALQQANAHPTHDLLKKVSLLAAVGDFYWAQSQTEEADLCYQEVAALFLRSNACVPSDLFPLLQYWRRTHQREKVDSFLRRMIACKVSTQKDRRHRVQLQQYALSHFSGRLREADAALAALCSDMRKVDDCVQLFYCKSQWSLVVVSSQGFQVLEREFQACVEGHKKAEVLRAIACSKLGDLYRTHARPEAEAQYRLALECLERVAPSGRLARKVTLSLGAFLKQSGRLAEAEEVLTVWLAQVSSLNQWDCRMAEALREVARLYLEGFRATEADALLQQALCISKRLQSLDSALAAEALGTLHLNFNRDEEARKYYFLTLLTLQHTPTAFNALLCKKNLAALCESHFNFDHAEVFLAKSNFKARSFSSSLRHAEVIGSLEVR